MQLLQGLFIWRLDLCPDFTLKKLTFGTLIFGQAAASCKLTFLPSAAAALARVVRVRLASFSSSNLFKAARLVCMRLASSVLVNF